MLQKGFINFSKVRMERQHSCKGCPFPLCMKIIYILYEYDQQDNTKRFLTGYNLIIDVMTAHATQENWFLTVPFILPYFFLQTFFFLLAIAFAVLDVSWYTGRKNIAVVFLRTKLILMISFPADILVRETTSGFHTTSSNHCIWACMSLLWYFGLKT